MGRFSIGPVSYLKKDPFTKLIDPDNPLTRILQGCFGSLIQHVIASLAKFGFNKQMRPAMFERFQTIISKFFESTDDKGIRTIFDPTDQFDQSRKDDPGIARTMNTAFLIALAGNNPPLSEAARSLLGEMTDSPQWGGVARFYLDGLVRVKEEIGKRANQDPDFSKCLEDLSQWFSQPATSNDVTERAEKIWSLFFPEAAGIEANRNDRIKALRKKRTVTIEDLNPSPISSPAREMLFTSNVLLTLPQEGVSLDEMPLSKAIKKALSSIGREPQLYWYDHPIPLGIEENQNEVIYGLKGLAETLAFERDRGNVTDSRNLKCLLSISVTHRGLHDIAKNYIRESVRRSGIVNHLDLYAFTEMDTEALRNDILLPAAVHYLQADDTPECFRVFGVDGEYGRHYTFLKAIAPFWSVLIEPEIRATFKVDLDQVFPQQELVEQTGASAFEHFRTTLWGAKGKDSGGRPLELGMIAGALVNQRDMGKSLFFPDVRFPDRPPAPDETIFFSALPQALSTEAEMGTRYGTGGIDGEKTCIQRIHVTGGTNGILVDVLRRYRPFTPSFIGRAEDQAYILSALPHRGRKLAYVHEDGLIMRHDKEEFAQETIKSSFVPKLVGDLIRTLYFSAYAGALSGDVSAIKDALDPFTGCFISKIPATVVTLRFSLKAGSFFAEGKDGQGLEFIQNGAKRLKEAFDFIEGKKSRLRETYRQERRDWDLFYNTLSALEDALAKGDPFALNLQKRAREIVDQCAVRF